MNNLLVTKHRIKNRLNVKIEISTLATHQKAASYWGLTWAEYVALPGGHIHIREDDPMGICKADVLVHYEMQTTLQAYLEDKQIEEAKKNNV